ncbi:MAG: SAM-dependent methyltransferase [Nanoarchaeota archaeon]
MATFVVEHLDGKLWRWCLIEYKHISRIVGKKSLLFTKVKSKELRRYGKVFKKSVLELSLKNACVLDPDAKKTLTPKDARKFKYFIFGGILGSYPAKKRTNKELTRKLKFTARNIGKKQFSTDNAVYVVREILKGKKLKDLKFKDKIEIQLGKHDSVILPYRYLIMKGRPLISEELVKYLKRRKEF